MSSGAPCSTARDIEAGGGTAKTESERGREEDVQIGLISPDGLLDKSRQMEILTRTGLKQRPLGPNAFKNG